MDAGVITTDLHGRIISINPRGQELVGLNTLSDSLSIQELGTEHALLASICDDMRKYHHPIRDRDYPFNANGHRITMRAGCSMLRNRRKEEVGMVIHVRDVRRKH